MIRAAMRALPVVPDDGRSSDEARATIRAPSASRAAAAQPPMTSQPRTATTAPADTATKAGVIDPSASGVIHGASTLPRPTGVGSTTIGMVTSRKPPRSRNAASASGQVAGVARVTSSAPVSAAPRFTAPGWPTPPRPVSPGPGTRTWSRCRAAWTRAISDP